ncbi:DNA-3-methyladenine glycosylase [Agrilactobacillus yilanensis]|uniref:Putative 3-methyladenine DNA glycosylase n=1 Tax=Agrilactobacillus yilanensis TaxID=2485997 RepID=A0ABW4J7X7_9LACO|nr:DNA-3-methyladenine glycosylase [Agrilactobacillus yilanensis]
MLTLLIDFFDHRPTPAIAQDLLGKTLLYHGPHGAVGGLIVETEAYLGQQDSAAHAYQGHRSRANEALYGTPGTIYIYQRHGQFCFDIATQAKDEPQGILIRSIEPTIGLTIMTQNRPRPKPYELTNGPGKLMQALGIQDTNLNLAHLDQAPLTIDLTTFKRPIQIQESPRIGVRKNGGWVAKPLRYFVAGNPYVSKMLKRDMALDSHGWQM